MRRSGRVSAKRWDHAPVRDIGVPRFELGTSPTRTERATRLRHTPSAYRVPLGGPEFRQRPPLNCRRGRQGRDRGVRECAARVERWPEFAPPGLQVVGADEVTLLLCGVSCSRELFEHAAEVGAEMVLVHHGLFWRNEPLVVDRRLRGRLEALFRATPRSSPTTSRSTRTRRSATRPSSRRGSARAGGAVRRRRRLACTLDGLTIDELAARVTDALDREPLVFADGPERIERLAISTGAAGYDLIRAAHEGFDALLTGEPEEPNFATARELGIHLVAAGHHATERFGVQALAAHLADHLRDRVALPRDRQPGVASSTVTRTRRMGRPFAVVLTRSILGRIMVHFGRRAR